MKAAPQFPSQSKRFWANVRLIGQKTGYTARGTGSVSVPTQDEMEAALSHMGLDASHIISKRHRLTKLGKKLHAYFECRARVLNDFVEPRLMDARRARQEFSKLKAQLRPSCPIPMNKQKGEKRTPAYLTGIVNMLIEANARGLPCDYDPRELAVVTRDGAPVRTFSRRADGAFPGVLNPVEMWEIKEYYHTTTFGSRVADAVYETLLDGMEFMELRENEGVEVKHYLMLDAHYTWWDCGRSYLCRIVDMLHMGYVDEVLFGYEVVERLPAIVSEWVGIANRQGQPSR